MAKKNLPVCCPSCGETLNVRRCDCPACGTAVEGDYDFPVLARLTLEEQTFLLHLVRCSGSLKELARIYGVSYPTVRNRLDTLIERLGALQAAEANALDEEERPTA